MMLHGQKEHIYTMEKKDDLRATFERDFKKVSYIPNGVTGLCFRAIVPTGTKPYAVHSCQRQYTKFPVQLRISGMFKGHGTIYIGFIVYDQQGKIYWITKAPGSYSPPITIDTDKWEKKSFTFCPSEENVQKISGFLTMISLQAGSEIFMDDIQTLIFERKNLTPTSTSDNKPKY